MAKEKKDGIVVKKHPGHFTIKLKDSGEEIKAHRCGKMRMHQIRLLEGDEVEVEVSEYGGRGIIKYRK